jgi:hypothetical protein
VTKTSENAVIFVTGVASSVLCITGYDLVTSTTNDDALNGLLLLIVGAVLFCGVAYGFYGTTKPERKFSYHAARRAREMTPAIAALPVKDISEATNHTGNPSPASSPSPSPSGQPAVAVMRVGLHPPDNSSAVRRSIPHRDQLRVEPGSVGVERSAHDHADHALAHERIPIAGKMDASALAEHDEVSAANDLIKVYTQLLIKLKDPSKQRTLKRWIAQQEEIVKAHKLKANPAKSA